MQSAAIKENIIRPEDLDKMITFLSKNHMEYNRRKASNLIKTLKELKIVLNFNELYLRTQEEKLNEVISKFQDQFKVFYSNHPEYPSRKKAEAVFYKIVERKKTSYQLKLITMALNPTKVINDINFICKVNYN